MGITTRVDTPVVLPIDHYVEAILDRLEKLDRPYRFRPRLSIRSLSIWNEPSEAERDQSSLCLNNVFGLVDPV